MPSYYPENNTPTPEDQPQRSLQKINSLLLAGGGGGGGTWGSITGDISNQTDLQAEFDTKQTIPTAAVSYAPAGTTQTVVLDAGYPILFSTASASGNVTLTLSNPQRGLIYLLEVTTGATPRTLIFPAGTTQPLEEGNTWTPSGATNVDVISFYWNGTIYRILETSAQQG